MQAKDIMTVNVVTVSEDTPVHEIVSVLLRYRISAVPVIDGARKVVGIVSEGDLLRGEGTSRTSVRHPWWLEAVFVGQTVTYDKARGRRAGAVMTRNVITVDEDAPLNEIAKLLHGLANTIVDHHEPGAAKDRQLRNELVKVLLSKHELDTALVNVTVADGSVRLWGIVENADQAAAAETTAGSLPGVKSLANNLGTGPISGEPI